jgi:hypothetical protein
LCNKYWLHHCLFSPIWLNLKINKHDCKHLGSTCFSKIYINERFCPRVWSQTQKDYLILNWMKDVVELALEEELALQLLWCYKLSFYNIILINSYDFSIHVTWLNYKTCINWVKLDLNWLNFQTKTSCCMLDIYYLFLVI